MILQCGRNQFQRYNLRTQKINTAKTSGVCELGVSPECDFWWFSTSPKKIMSHEGTWNNLNFFNNRLLFQCCLYLWFITCFVQHSCIFSSHMHCACVCLFYKAIPNEKCFFIAIFPCHKLLAYLWVCVPNSGRWMWQISVYCRMETM